MVILCTSQHEFMSNLREGWASEVGVIANPIKLENPARPNSAGIPDTLYTLMD